ncbi:MAG: hypothetical protein BK997_01110 [Candidatus Micrarchaeum sp. ARMAN-1]|nr:MAG: hypothetical protein BK997_01110 [Candidatus Micrarchaeum sp. ARMAN-1]
MEELEFLKSLGFVKVGEWNISAKNNDGIVPCINENYAKKRVIYAFVIGKSVKYIGIVKSEKRTLKDRMNEYKTPNSPGKGSTNREIGKKIIDTLKTNPVEIYALDSNMNISEAASYKGLQIDLVAGLESSLISKFNLKEKGWNKSS